jgi:hypothetical protein
VLYIYPLCAVHKHPPRVPGNPILWGATRKKKKRDKRGKKVLEGKGREDREIDREREERTEKPDEAQHREKKGNDKI